MLSALFLTALMPLLTLACPDHNYHAGGIAKRAETAGIDWAYEASYNWGLLSEDFHLCQDGTQQSPIPLLLTQGLSLNHQITYNYPRTNTSGTFLNWGYGPAMTLAHAEGVYTTLPSFTFEENGVNETVYMTGWHVHSPGDHSVQGDRSKAELHFVHVSATGTPRAVLAIRIDPGNADSAFFAQLPRFISYREEGVTTQTQVKLDLALQEVNFFSEFWTYQGGLPLIFRRARTER
jgi:carbonic anhydrase